MSADNALKDQPHLTPKGGSRPAFRNIHVLDILKYRLPPAGIVSILHRVSGALMFLLLPFIVWMFDTSLSTEQSYERFTAVFLGSTGWFFKLVALALIWAYLHHILAGLRHLWMDATHAVTLRFGRLSALATLGLSVLLTLVLGAKLFFF
ncbi:MAG TPA: succinate dehydrogenase, cytochrome b556 subunit [Burkholderiaceae bacterium]|nr:succinate dehydrogenase, cytochrome b556 subunit [Burkholderiaceae bacterium]